MYTPVLLDTSWVQGVFISRMYFSDGKRGKKTYLGRRHDNKPLWDVIIQSPLYGHLHII